MQHIFSFVAVPPGEFKIYIHDTFLCAEETGFLQKGEVKEYWCQTPLKEKDDVDIKMEGSKHLQLCEVETYTFAKRGNTLFHVCI